MGLAVSQYINNIIINRLLLYIVQLQFLFPNNYYFLTGNIYGQIFLFLLLFTVHYSQSNRIDFNCYLFINHHDGLTYNPSAVWHCKRAVWATKSSPFEPTKPTRTGGIYSHFGAHLVYNMIYNQHHRVKLWKLAVGVAAWFDVALFSLSPRPVQCVLCGTVSLSLCVYLCTATRPVCNWCARYSNLEIGLYCVAKECRILPKFV